MALMVPTWSQTNEHPLRINLETPCFEKRYTRNFHETSSLPQIDGWANRCTNQMLKLLAKLNIPRNYWYEDLECNLLRISCTALYSDVPMHRRICTWTASTWNPKILQQTKRWMAVPCARSYDTAQYSTKTPPKRKAIHVKKRTHKDNQSRMRTMQHSRMLKTTLPRKVPTSNIPSIACARTHKHTQTHRHTHTRTFSRRTCTHWTICHEPINPNLLHLESKTRTVEPTSLNAGCLQMCFCHQLCQRNAAQAQRAFNFGNRHCNLIGNSIPKHPSISLLPQSPVHQTSPIQSQWTGHHFFSCNASLHPQICSRKVAPVLRSKKKTPLPPPH